MVVQELKCQTWRRNQLVALSRCCLCFFLCLFFCLQSLLPDDFCCLCLPFLLFRVHTEKPGHLSAGPHRCGAMRGLWQFLRHNCTLRLCNEKGTKVSTRIVSYCMLWNVTYPCFLAYFVDVIFVNSNGCNKRSGCNRSRPLRSRARAFCN